MLDNVRAPLEKRGYHLAEKYFAATGLNPETDGKKYPDELSGGMQQRTALARVLAYDAELLLLDEPFSALDEDMADYLLSLIKEFAKDKTIILVTHNSSHAKKFAETIYILKQQNT